MKLLLPLFLSPLAALAQQTFDLLPGRPVSYNGLDYGFEIRNERKKEVKDEQYGRFEITVFVMNKSGCSRVLFPRQTAFGEEMQNQLATFDCLNATGKRLTSKGTTLLAQSFSVPFRQQIKNAEGKTVTQVTQVPAGHLFRNGETVAENLIVIVPEGEAPRLKVRVRDLPDL